MIYHLKMLSSPMCLSQQKEVDQGQEAGERAVEEMEK
jgi:hypothetical protein